MKLLSAPEERGAKLTEQPKQGRRKKAAGRVLTCVVVWVVLFLSLKPIMATIAVADSADTVVDSRNPVAITVQPVGATVNPGTAVTFSVSATGGMLSYQWRKGGMNISGATSATYTLTPVAESDEGGYDVVVSNVLSSVASSSVILTANDPVMITEQPVGRGVLQGAGVSFSVTAIGTGTLSYQWRLNGTNIVGATSSTYAIASVAGTHSGTYTCAVTNIVGTVVSNAAELSVGPAITVQPVGATVNPGTSLTLSVTATGSLLSYQWRKGGVNISGATGSEYTINPVAETDEGSYDVLVSNGLGSVTSSSVTLIVNDPVMITAHPVSQGVLQGAGVSFSVTANGTGSLSYQWRLNGTNISGATAATFTIASVTGTHSGTYTCAVTNIVGTVVSNGAVLTVGAAITAQPVGATVNPGRSLSLSVTATGSSLSYQWRKGGVNISGATGSVYTINPVAETHEGSYDVVVSNGLGSVTSSSVTLSVNDPVAITVQPLSFQGVLQGASASLALTATGTGPLAYQWRLNGTNINGATSATYTIASVNGTHEGSYTCAVTNVVGTVVSSVAVLRVGPAITAQPVGATVNPGASCTLSVTATGTALAYQWRKGGVNISGANGSTYTINPSAESDEGSYDVVVVNFLGSVTSSSVTLSVNDPIMITAQPVGATVNPGTAVSLSVTASGTGPLSYQWRKGGVSISGATASIFTINPAAESHEGSYDVVVTNVVGSVTSSSTALSVNDPVAITVQPLSQGVLQGASVSLAVTATGTGPLSYQWRLNGMNISGATSATYSTATVNGTHAGTYTCAVTNVVGTVVSNGAVLTVGPGITVQPINTAANPGASVSLSVTASGTGPLSYQWRKGGVNISGATGSTYTIGSAAESHEGSYDVIVTNGLGSVTSAPAVLSVNDPLAITGQPVGATVNPWTSVSLSVTATGTGPLSYQWRRNGVAVSGATSATYTMNPVAESHEGNYDVVITNVVGSVTSAAAVLTVNDPVVITSQPVGATLNPGGFATFSVTATGTPPLSYQWRKGGVAIVGATGAAYTVSSAVEADEGSYSVLVTNIASSVVSGSAFLGVNDLVVITSQPVGVTVNPGGTASFSVAATGVGTLTYQWRKNGASISGATGSTYTIGSVAESDEGSYSVVVTGVEGSTTSLAAQLTVNDPVGITVQPVDRTVNPGAPVSFSVGAVGVGPLSYQWRKGSTNIAGATGAFYTIAAAAEADEGSYSVVVSNALGTVASTSAILSVNDPVLISGQPVGASVNPGTLVSFNVTASGSGTLSYQWRRNGVALVGATSATYTINPVSDSHEGDYDVVVTNVVGSLPSSPARLIVNDPPAITLQPASRAVNPGASVGFSVTATGTEPLVYQWRKGSTNIPGATGSTYTLGSVAESDEGSYSVLVTNGLGSVTSAAAILSVNDPVVITLQPGDRAVNPGISVSLSVTASGTGPLSYQWRKSGVNISGATSSTYAINPVSESHEGNYDVVVTNVVGSMTSAAAVLSVNDPVVITAQPEVGPVNPGDAVTFFVDATGTGPLSFQWRKDGVNISGATRSTYTINPVSESHEGNYDVVVTNVVGSATSWATGLRVEDGAYLVFGSALYPCLKGPGEAVLPVTVRRMSDFTKPVSVVVAASSETLVAGDYALPASPMVLRWEAGDRADKTFQIVIRAGLMVSEAGETLRLSLLNPDGAGIGEIGEATVALSARNPGVLMFGAGSVERVKPDTGDLVTDVVVRRGQGTSGAVSAEVVVSGGTALAGDYLVDRPVRLEWADGDASDKTFPVVFKAAAVVPLAGKTIQFKLQNLTGGALPGAVGACVVTVRQAALPGTVAFSSAGVQAVKAESGDTLVPVTVNRMLGGSGAVSVQVAVTGGTASSGTDYELASNPETLSWADAEMGPKTLNILLKAGAQIAAGGETILLKLQGATGGVLLGRQATATVQLVSTDLSGPVIVVESPGSGSTVSGGSVLFKGTATDASAVTRVEVTLNDDEPQSAVLAPTASANTSAWMLTLVPEQGANTVKIRAYDSRGNISAEMTRGFRFSYLRAEFAGTYDGLLQPQTSGAELLEQFPLSPGIAQLFRITRGSGLLTASVTASGAVSGKVTTGGVVTAFKGVVMRDGTVLFGGKFERLPVRKTEGKVITELGALSLRIREGDPAVMVGEFSMADGAIELATVEAEKYVYSAARVLPAGMQRVPLDILDPASEKGRYTALFESRVDEGMDTNGGLDGDAFPQASGYAKLTVSAAGVVSITGKLADGAVVSYSNRLSPSGTVPVYVPMYANRGFLSGVMGFDAAQLETDLAGPEMRWFRPSGLAAPYSAGWPEGIRVDLVGSKYVAPGVPTRTVPVPANRYGVFGPEVPVNSVLTDTVPDFVPVEVWLSGGGLSAEIANSGRVSGGNVLSLTGVLGAGSLANGLKWAATASDGGFAGSFTHPATSKLMPFAGVVLQKTRRAGGFFVYVPAAGGAVPAGVGGVEITVP